MRAAGEEWKQGRQQPERFPKRGEFGPHRVVLF
jgi:hypothetical protein